MEKAQSTPTRKLVCENCGKALSQGIVFCPNCGERVDGKVECPECRQLTEKDAKFCSHCGARIDGKKVCKNCGAEYEGNFCPICGKGQKVQERQKIKSGQTGFCKIERIVSTSLMISALAVLFICTFLIGVRYEFPNEMGSMYDLPNEISVSIFDFFKVIDFEAVFCILAFFGTAIVSFIMLIIGAISGGKIIAGKKGGSILPKVLTSFVLFLIASGLLLSYGFSTPLGETVRLSKGSIVGIVYTAVVILASLVLKKISLGKKYFNLKSILKMSFLAVIIILVSVCISLYCKTLIHIGYREVVSKYSVNTFLRLASEWNVEVGIVVAKLLAILLYVIYLVALPLLCVTLSITIKRLFDDEKNQAKVMAFSIVNTVLSLIYLNLARSLRAELVNKIHRNSIIGIVNPVVLFVLSIIILGLAITNRVIEKKDKAKE